jgi:hypothetical protein
MNTVPPREVAEEYKPAGLAGCLTPSTSIYSDQPNDRVRPDVKPLPLIQEVTRSRAE